MTFAALLGGISLCGLLVALAARFGASVAIEDFLKGRCSLRRLRQQVRLGETGGLWISLGVIAVLIHFSEWLTKTDNALGQVLGLTLGVGVFGTVLVEAFRGVPSRVRERLHELLADAAKGNSSRQTLVNVERPHFAAASADALPNAMERIRAGW